MNRISIKHIITLTQKDIALEIRQQYSFYGMLLYVVSTIFIIQFCINSPAAEIWNALFWLIQLFVCVNAVSKSFLAESKGRLLYYYSIAKANEILIAKLLSNIVLMLFLSMLSIVFFILFLDNPLQHILLFVGINLLGSFGFSILFSFLSSIAMKAQQQTALIAILGFPLIIPQLWLLITLSQKAFSNVFQSGTLHIFLNLIAFDVLTIALALILFPFVWKD
jgi:heme exporter protein B